MLNTSQDTGKNSSSLKDKLLHEKANCLMYKHVEAEDDLFDQNIRDIYGHVFELSQVYTLKEVTQCQFDYIYKKYLLVSVKRDQPVQVVHLYVTALVSLRLAMKFEEVQAEMMMKTEIFPYQDIIDKIVCALSQLPDFKMSKENICNYI